MAQHINRRFSPSVGVEVEQVYAEYRRGCLSADEATIRILRLQLTALGILSGLPLRSTIPPLV